MGRRTGADAVPQSFHVWPDIQLNGSPLSHEMEGLLEQVIVDHPQPLPDMFAIAFHDPDRNVLSTLHATIGDSVTIKVTPPGGSPETLIKGELTGFEAEYGATRLRTVLRGYDKSHRLHRGRRTETYKNVTDSDIARTVANRASLTIGQIDSTSGTFDRSEEHTSELQSPDHLVCRLLLEKKNIVAGTVLEAVVYRQDIFIGSMATCLYLQEVKN